MLRAKTEKDIYSPAELEESLSKKKFSPLYYFFGENDFLIDEYTNRIIELNVDATIKSFNVDVLDGNIVKVNDLLRIVSSYPLNADKRIVVVKQFKKLITSKNEDDNLIRYIEKPLSTTILIMIGDKLDMRTSFAQALKNNCIIVEFKNLYDNQMPEWIKKRVKFFKKNITDNAARLITDYIGNSMREINAELEKLSLFVNEKDTIDIEDVVAVVGMSKAFNVFALQKSIGERNISDALFILENMLNRGESPIGVIAILSKYFHKLWAIRAANLGLSDIMKVLKMQQFAAIEYQKAASNFNIEEIEDIILQLVKADESLKTSSNDEKLTMTMLIYGIIKGVSKVAM